ncbi:MAG: hypothetical protein QXO77_02815 [Saccharolobus sp.]
MSIYYEWGTAQNLSHLLSLLKNFLTFYGWSEVSSTTSSFVVTKTINNNPWYWMFTINTSSTTLDMTLGYSDNNTNFYSKQIMLSYSSGGERYWAPYAKILSNSLLNYIFILNTNQPGDNLILTIYQNHIFTTSYIGYIDLQILDDSLYQTHQFVCGCYKHFNYTFFHTSHHDSLSFLYCVYNYSFSTALSIAPSFYVNPTQPNVPTISGGWFQVGTDNRFPSLFNAVRFLPSLLPDIPVLQAIPVYLYINNNWAYIGNLKGIYATRVYQAERPSIQTFGNQSYILVPTDHLTMSLSRYASPTTIAFHKDFTYAIQI